MGWYFGRREKGESDLDYFKREGLDASRIVAYGSTMKAFYFAYRDGDGEVSAGVWLKQWSRDYYNFGYKPLDEFMGPYEYDVPAKVLDALTETTNETALAWRAKARARLERRAKARAVKKGDTVRFTGGIRFTTGRTLDTFVFEGGSKFSSGYSRYHIRGWRDRAFEVVTDEVAVA